MGTTLSTLLTCITILALSLPAYAQPPKGKAPDDLPSAGDRPRLEPPSPGDAPRPRREPRPDDEGPPRPGKAASRPRVDSGSYPQAAPMPAPGLPGPGGFGGGFGGAGFGGGMRSGGFGGGMPGPAGPFGEPHDDPEMRDLMKQDAELEHQSFQMAQRIREASGDERQRIRESLGDVVSKHFDVRQKRRELQIKRMEEELKRLRDEIAKRNDARKAIIDNRFRELTGESRDLDF